MSLRATVIGLPVSCASIFAISSACLTIKSANFIIMRPRSVAVIRPHAPCNARRAACTAKSISAAVPRSILLNTFASQGLITSMVAPAIEETHLPSMSKVGIRNSLKNNLIIQQ